MTAGNSVSDDIGREDRTANRTEARIEKIQGIQKWLKWYLYLKKLEIGDCNRQCPHLSSFPSEAFFIRFHISFP